MNLPSLEHSVAELLPSGTRKLLVAVSGGVDSVVLLHLLKTISSELEFTIHVAHLDHRLRPESSSDADFVRQLCRQWDLPCSIESCDIRQLAARQKISLEMAGRQARREFLWTLAQKIGAELIALAHHGDDQVETFMLRLLRGSGQSGLSAMRVHQGCWWRPLLNLRRQDIVKYASQHNLKWVEDESNRDSMFLRNRLRSEIIPQFYEINPRFGGGIERLVQQFQVDEDYWQREVTAIFDSLVVSREDGLRLSRPKLLATHPALRVRLLRAALLQVRGDLQKIESVHLLAVDDLLSASRSQGELNLPECWVARRYESLWIRRGSPALPEPFDLTLPDEGEVKLPDGRIIRASTQVEQEGESAMVVEFSLAALSQPLRVRNWRPGDRFEPLGMSGHKRLKRFFSDNRVEREVRLRTPLLVSGETILWVGGMRRSRHAVVRCDAGEIIRIELF